MDFPLTYKNDDSTQNDTIGINFNAYVQNVDPHLPSATFSIDYSVDDVAFDSLPSSVSSTMQTSNISFDVYPNPVSTYCSLYYHFDYPTSIHSHIYDITGRKIITLPVESVNKNGIIPFDCARLKNGLYYVMLQAGERVLMRKIVVQH
jgi:hypothetical protein